MIYTSYFAQLKNLPKNAIPVAICGKSPDWYTGFEYKKLAPKYKFFMEWKINQDNGFYMDHFQKEVLDTLNPDQVYQDLMKFCEKSHMNPEETDIILLCYEKPNEFCHRHLVANWLSENGYECRELQIGIL